MKSFLQRKLINPLVGLLKQGATPSKLALAISLGIVIGMVPVFGTCTLLCLIAAWVFKVNVAPVLIANQFAFPLQFALYFPFIRTGEWIFHQKPIPFSIEQIVDLFSEDLVKAVSLVGWSTLYGLIVWLIASIPIHYALFTLFKMIFEKTLIRNTSPTKQEGL